MLSPQSLNEFIENNRDKLVPPVNAYPMFPMTKDGMLVMVIGGPNQRDDFHVNPTPEFFYQYQGDMILKIINDKKEIEPLKIREGEMFVLPANVPHSPQRFKDTIGCVLEIPRREGDKDSLLFCCEKCGPESIVYQDSFICKNLVEQIGISITEYSENKNLRTCSKCGFINKNPKTKEYN